MTRALLPMLPADSVDYVFTDVSAGFLERAAKDFAAFSFVDYRTPVLERSPTEQGFELGSFDVVVASNVVHATRNMRETLKNVRSLLAPCGWLMVLEVTQPTLRGETGARYVADLRRRA